MTKVDLLAKVKELKELKAMVKEIEATMGVLETEIKDEMDTLNIPELFLTPYTVRYTPVVSNKFDSSAFKRDHKDLYDEYTKPVESRRFSIN